MRTYEVHDQKELNEALKEAGRDDLIACVGSACFEVIGSASVTASGSVSVRAFDSASVRAFDSASVRASGSASVRAFDSASVRAFDSASVRASGSVSVRAFDSASVTASGSASVTASGSASVTAFDSASVTAFDSASVRASGSASVRAFDSASVTASGSASVTASGSASVTAFDSASVTAFDSASVRASGSASVRASGSASVRASGSASVTASKYVSVHKHAETVKVKGGVLINIPQITTAEEWCEFYGVEVKRGIATLYKSVDDDYSTAHARAVGISYKPGTKPSAPDWDGGKEECGGGLHFCPHPIDALRFNGGERLVACPVKLSEIVVHKDADYPNKVKAPRVYGPIVEVDIDGTPRGRDDAAPSGSMEREAILSPVGGRGRVGGHGGGGELGA